MSNNAMVREAKATVTRTCKGHPPGPNDPMGMAVYCDGSCVARPPERPKGRRCFWFTDAEIGALRSIGQMMLDGGEADDLGITDVLRRAIAAIDDARRGR